MKLPSPLTGHRCRVRDLVYGPRRPHPDPDRLAAGPTRHADECRRDRRFRGRGAVDCVRASQGFGGDAVRAIRGPPPATGSTAPAQPASHRRRHRHGPPRARPANSHIAVVGAHPWPNPSLPPVQIRSSTVTPAWPVPPWPVAPLPTVTLSCSQTGLRRRRLFYDASALAGALRASPAAATCWRAAACTRPDHPGPGLRRRSQRAAARIPSAAGMGRTAWPEVTNEP